MADKLRIDGVNYSVNDQPRQIQALEGLGLSADLAASEAASWRRYVPGGRMPWKEVTAYEKEIARLEERRREVEEGRHELYARLQSAPEADLAALADWERDGRRGSRPEPTGPALEAELERLQQQERALLLAIDKTTAERAAHVDRHRDRLVGEAGKIREKAHERAARALDELEASRAELVEARRLELWAQLYPAAEAGREPNFASLGGGLRRVGETIGLQAATAAELVIAAMRADVDWVSSAVTREQQAKLAPRPVTPDEFDRERDREVEAALSLHAQGRSDQRRGELDRMKAKL